MTIPRQKRAQKEAGAPPGTLVFTGNRKVAKVRIQLMDYDSTQFSELEPTDINECLHFRETASVTWIDLSGLHEIESVEKLGSHFGIHPLVLEDVLHPTQRSKVEDHDDTLFLVIRLLSYDEELLDEQFSLILGSNFVMSFQERPGQVFSAVRERIRNGKGRIRKLGPDYLVYALIDAAVDEYFHTVDALRERLEDVESRIIHDPEPEDLQEIHALKSDVLRFRRAVWPLRETVGSLQRGDSSLLSEEITIFLKDLNDHVLQIREAVDSLVDTASALIDLHLSTMSQRTNDVMKVLTIMASIFIPLTFVAGIYGMNFENMPELKWAWGYPVVLIAMGLILLGLLIYFKRRKWI